MKLSGKILEQMEKKSKVFTDALKANACDQESPSKQWRCILPKGHGGDHRQVAVATWQGNKERLEAYK